MPVQVSSGYLLYMNKIKWLTSTAEEFAASDFCGGMGLCFNLCGKKASPASVNSRLQKGEFRKHHTEQNQTIFKWAPFKNECERLRERLSVWQLTYCGTVKGSRHFHKEQRYVTGLHTSVYKRIKLKRNKETNK